MIAHLWSSFHPRTLLKNDTPVQCLSKEYNGNTVWENRDSLQTMSGR